MEINTWAFTRAAMRHEGDVAYAAISRSRARSELSSGSDAGASEPGAIFLPASSMLL